MSILRRAANGASALVVAFSSVMAIMVPATAFAAAQSCEWTGTAGDSKFSTAANWTNCNSDVPQDGDGIVFNIASTPAQGNSTQTLDNDLDISYSSISSSTTSQTSLSGYEFANDLSLTADAVWDSNQQLGLYMATDTAINVAGNFTVYEGSIWTPITASVVTLKEGAFFYDKAFASSTLTGLTIENGAGVYCYGNGSNVSISYPITLGGGSGTQKPFIEPAGCGPMPSINTTLANVTLVGDAEVSVYTPGVFTVTNLTANSHTLTRSQSATGTLVTPAGTQEQQAKTTALDGDQASQDVSVVNKETAILSGKRATVTVLTSGILKGTGSATLIDVRQGGIVAPGNSPGCLTSDNLILSGEYQFEIGGTEACTGYDQLKVLNAANSNDAVSINSTSATLTTSLYNDFAPKKGEVYVIIEQGGDKAVTGTFKDLPESATFTQNGIVFKISYVGGDGNDVSLTVQSVPATPDTGFALVSAHPLISLVALAGISGMLVVLARRSSKLHGKA